MKNKNIAQKIWDIVYPILLYYVVLVIVMFLVQTFFGGDESTYMFRQLIASLVTLPVIYTHYRYDRILEDRPTFKEILFGKGTSKNTGYARSNSTATSTVITNKKGKVNKRATYKATYAAQHTPVTVDRREQWLTVLVEIIIAALLGISLNNLISMTPLVTLSTGYQEANQNFYSGPVIFEVLSSGLVVPFLEETLFRGVVYQRLKRDFPLLPSMLLSAILFGVVHFNVVQFLYAFLIGIALSIFMEWSGHLYGAIVGHITANLIAIVRTETGWLGWTTDGSAVAWAVSCVLLAAGILLLAAWSRTLQKKYIK